MMVEKKDTKRHSMSGENFLPVDLWTDRAVKGRAGAKAGMMIDPTLSVSVSTWNLNFGHSRALETLSRGFHVIQFLDSQKLR